METRWLYTTAKDFPMLVERSKKTCIIPVGCVEKHGLHLPMGQDIIQVSRIAHEASKLEEVCIFPDFIFGDVPGANIVGSIGIPVATQLMLLEQLCDEIGKSGFEKILLFNGHGGNVNWLNQFMRDIQMRKKPYAIIYSMIKLWVPHKMANIITAEGSGAIPELTKEDEELLIKYRDEDMKIEHAGMSETAYMMGISPESVHLEYLGEESGLSTHASKYLKDAGLSIVDGGWGVDYPNAFTGHDPIGCNERMGKAQIRLETERLAHSLKVLKEDENIMKWHREKMEKLIVI